MTWMFVLRLQAWMLPTLRKGQGRVWAEVSEIVVQPQGRR